MKHRAFFFYLGQVNQLYIFRNEYKSCTSLQELQLEAFTVKQCDSDVLCVLNLH